MKDDHPETLASGTLYTVNVQNDYPPAPTFHELFERAASTYPLIYLWSKKKGNPLKLGDVSTCEESLFRDQQKYAAQASCSTLRC